MKRFLVIAYWIVSILLVSIALSSLGYRFMEALFIGTMFLPGALAAKYFFPKVDFRNRGKGMKETVFIVLGILVGEVLLLLVAHYYIAVFRTETIIIYNLPDIPQILTNPVFIAIILTALAAGCYYFESWLDRKRAVNPGRISFTSERKKVTLPVGEILYVESNDDITVVIATEGRRFKNYTPISQWEAILSPNFTRIHRSYLVNQAAITHIDGDILYIGDTELPISRKYKASLES